MTSRKQNNTNKRTSPPRDKLPAQPRPHKKSARYIKPDFQPSAAKAKEAAARSPLEGMCYDLEFDYRPVLIRGEVEFLLVDVQDLIRLHKAIHWERRE